MSEQYPPSSSQPSGAPQYSNSPQNNGAPQYSNAPQSNGASNGPVPGRTLGIVGLILAFVASPIGLVLSIIAMVQSKKAGAKNGFALAGIIIGVLGTIIIIAAIIGAISLAGAFGELCAELGSGVHEQGNTTITCP
jgi:hypothetical protein